MFQLSNKKLSELEGVAVDTIIAMVLKLSESSFKPFLFKVKHWYTFFFTDILLKIPLDNVNKLLDFVILSI